MDMHGTFNVLPTLPICELGMALAKWFAKTKHLFLPRNVQGSGVQARCHYCLVAKQDTAAIRKTGRTHFPNILLDIWQLLFETRQTGPGTVANIDLGFLWSKPQECTECGHQGNVFDEFLPAIICRQCGQKHAMHHERCCPVQPTYVLGTVDFLETQMRRMLIDPCDPNSVKQIIKSCTPTATFQRVLEEGWLEAHLTLLASPA